jgi:hypothetical protein
MKEYYSPGQTQSLRNKIATFAQYPRLIGGGGSTSQVLEGGSRSKVLPRTHHGVKDDHRCIGGRIHH